MSTPRQVAGTTKLATFFQPFGTASRRPLKEWLSPNAYEYISSGAQSSRTSAP